MTGEVNDLLMRRLMIALFAAASAGLIATSCSAAAQLKAAAPGRSQLIVELGEPALSSIKSETVVKGKVAAQFSVFDWGVCALDEYSTMNDALKAFGQYDAMCVGSSENDVTLEYSWGSVDFHAAKDGAPPLFCGAALKTDEIEGLRGIRVGDGFQDALSNFPSTGCQRLFGDSDVLYCGDPYATTGTPLPPCAVLNSHGGFQSLVLAAPTTPLRDGDILCSDYYICRIQAINGKITAITCHKSAAKALAEQLGQL